MNRLTPLIAFGFALAISTPGATAREDDEFTKVNYYHLSADISDQRAHDPMIRFERKHLLRGAVTLEDQESRYGSYYTLMWKVADRSAPVKIRLEYRQQRSAGAVRVREAEISEIKRRNVTKFAIIGDEFSDKGRVVAWRATIVRGGEVIASTESFLWD